MNKINKEIKIWLAASVIGVFIAYGITATQAYAISVQNEIADNVIRFHVIANSDDPEDQAIKNTVRDGILDRFGGMLDPKGSIEDTRMFLTENLDDIESYAAILAGYPVKGIVGQASFPTRTYARTYARTCGNSYGNLSFPAGEYEALRLIIGDGRGGNWWCVMFPPLCYVDAATPEPSGQTVFGTLLSEDTYALMNHTQNGNGVTVRFKIVEWWQERLHPSDAPDASTFALQQ